MAEVTSLNLIGELTLDERAGVPFEARQRAIVTWEDEFDSIEAVFNAVLTADGLPDIGDEIEINGEDLVLEERVVRVEEPKRAVVDIVYRREEIFVLGGGEGLTVRGGTATKQIQTATERDGVTGLKVTHKGEESTGHVNVFWPQSTLLFEVTAATSSPGIISIQWTNHVNSETWQGGEPRTWLCSNVGFEPVNLRSVPPKWRISFEFTYDANGWDPTYVFIDPETGKPAVGLEEGEGIKDLEWYTDKDFGQWFPGGG